MFLFILELLFNLLLGDLIFLIIFLIVVLKFYLIPNLLYGEVAGSDVSGTDVAGIMIKDHRVLGWRIQILYYL